MFELKQPTESEMQEFKEKYVLPNGWIDWDKLNQDIKKDIKEQIEKTARWQEWAIRHSVPTD